MNTIPKTAVPTYIGLIPDLDFKIVCYETKNGFYVQVNGNEIEKTNSFDSININRCVKDAWTLDTGGYARENFTNECPAPFLQSMLDQSCQLAGIYHKNCYILERLKLGW